MTQHQIQEQQIEITVRLFAAAAHAAETEEARLQLSDDAPTLGDVIGSLPGLLRDSVIDDPVATDSASNVSATTDAAPDPSGAAGQGPGRRAPSLEAVCARSSYLLNGRRVHDRRTPLASGDVLDVLPPFAGG